jgi:hypothetical protein
LRAPIDNLVFERAIDEFDLRFRKIVGQSPRGEA